jgi:hypothetical protein
VALPGTIMIGTAINGPSYIVLTTSQNTCQAGIAVGQSCTLPVEFSPVAIGDHYDTLTLNPGGGVAPIVINLVGVATGIGTTMETPLEFGTIPFGTTKVLSLNLTNIGVTANVVSVSQNINGPSYRVLTTGNTCQGYILEGHSCTLPVEFSPASVGVHNDLLTITPSCCGVAPSTLHLLGTASATGVGPAMNTPLLFGKIPLGTTEVLSLTITNYGVPGTVTVEAASNGPSYQFLTTGNTCLAGITTGQSCVLPIEFAPIAVGLHDDILTLTPSGGTAPSTVSLTGEAIGVGATMEVPLEFGTISVGPTKVLPLTILNHGVAGKVMITAKSNGPSYSVLTTAQNTCLGGIVSGQSCVLPIQFAPTLVGGHTDVLTLTPTGGAAASVVTLKGTAAP